MASSSRFYELSYGSRSLFIAEVIVITALFIFGIDFAALLNPEIVPLNQLGADELFVHLALFITPLQLAALAVGLYNPKQREGFRGQIRRLVVSMALAYFATTFLYVVLPFDELPGNYREWLSLIALFALLLVRYLSFSMRYKESGRRRVLVLGAGKRASIIEQRMRRKVDRLGFQLIGFVPMPGDSEQGIRNEKRIQLQDQSLEDYVLANEIEEIVVACDERRNNLPVDCLFNCKIRGIDVTEILDFIERETGQIAVNLIYPSWVIYSNGFRSTNYLRNSLDWLFNASLATLIFVVTWPVMLVTAAAIFLESGRPIFYTQERIGLAGRPFRIIKFRSMRTDAEKDGAQFAQKNDSRVTRVGKFIRQYRIDELPQLWNVIRGDMGFVGPRPERPEFVTDLIRKIPYYNERHNVKPGLTGWAQLKYPYGSSYNDSLEKLKFDLYYIKHRSFLLDLMILLRTAEIVLFGKGR